MRSERKRRLLGLALRALEALLGERRARSAARLHPALDAVAAYRRFLVRHDVRVAPPSSGDGPLVSILLPLFQAPVHALGAALESVRRQSYGRFEVCVAGAGSDASRRLLTERAARDPRLRLLSLDANRGIGGNTNAALAAARGDFALFLDQDDALAPDALQQLVAAVARRPDLDVAYSDKDNVTPWGERYDPYLKPDWSPELLLSTNFVAHASLVRRELLADVGGLATDLDGAQDWDLFLRLAERTDRIAHVPRILYHWRSLPSSAASSPAAKPGLPRAWREALGRALERRGVPGCVPGDGDLRILPAFEKPPSISVVTRSTESDDARGDFVLVQEPGFRPASHDWMTTLALWASVAGVGAAGAVVHDRSGAIEHTGFVFPEGGPLPLFAGASPGRWTPLGRPEFVRNVVALGPGAWMTRRDVLDAVGPASSAVDYSRRVRAAGLRCVVVPQAVLVRTAGRLELPGPIEGGDPHFNPNLDPASPIPRPRDCY